MWILPIQKQVCNSLRKNSKGYFTIFSGEEDERTPSQLSHAENESMNQSVCSYAPKQRLTRKQTVWRRELLWLRRYRYLGIEAFGRRYFRIWSRPKRQLGVCVEKIEKDKLRKTMNAISSEGKLRKNASRTKKNKEII